MKLGLSFSLAAAVHTLHLLSFLPIFAAAQSQPGGLSKLIPGSKEFEKIAKQVCNTTPQIEVETRNGDYTIISTTYSQNVTELTFNLLNGWRAGQGRHIKLYIPGFMLNKKYYKEDERCPKGFAVHECAKGCLPKNGTDSPWPPKCPKDSHVFDLGVGKCTLVQGKFDPLNLQSKYFHRTLAEEVICKATNRPEIDYNLELNLWTIDVHFNMSYKEIIHRLNGFTVGASTLIALQMPKFMFQDQYYNISDPTCPVNFRRHSCTRSCLPYQSGFDEPPSCRDSFVLNEDTLECMAQTSPVPGPTKTTQSVVSTKLVDPPKPVDSKTTTTMPPTQTESNQPCPSQGLRKKRRADLDFEML